MTLNAAEVRRSFSTPAAPSAAIFPAIRMRSLRFRVLASFCIFTALVVHAIAQTADTDLESLIRDGNVDQLKRRLAAPGADVNARSSQDMSLLDIAAKFDRIDAATYLLDHGAQVESRKKSWPNVGITALHVAAYFGSVKVEQLLLDRGADVDTRAEVGATPLMFAAAAGQLATARMLIDKGAHLDLTIPRDDQTALDQAITGQHLEMARYLESRGAHVDGGILGQAAFNGDAETVRFVLAHDVDAKALDTGLRFAVIGEPSLIVERKQILSDLLARGADIDNLVDGLPPIVNARTADMVEFLIQHGAGKKTHTADTLIVRGLACRNATADKELVKIFTSLQSHGIEVRDDKEPGQSALDCVRQKGLTAATNYLLAVEPVAAAAAPSAPTARSAMAAAPAWLVGVFEANIAGARGSSRLRLQCDSASKPCTMSVQDDRFPEIAQPPDQLDPAVPLDSGPANAALAHTRQVVLGNPSLYDEQSSDGDALRSLRPLLTSKDTLAECVDLYAKKVGPLYMSACMRSSDRRARHSLVFISSTMAGAPSALSNRPFQYLSFIELGRASR